jgi:AcrR family transcriptional regulator
VATTEPAKRRGRPPSGGKEAILEATLELLRERGIARLTTREVAERAGTSEASIFYHYRDRARLLQAVFERGLEPLQRTAAARCKGGDAGEVMLGVGKGIEGFLEQALPILVAAQSDTELQRALASYIEERDLGPHRGVALLAGYLAEEQRAGRVRADVEPEAVATMLVSTCFMRASQRQLMGHGTDLEPLEDVVAALARLLAAP